MYKKKDPGNGTQIARSARKQIWFFKIPSAHFSQAPHTRIQPNGGATTGHGFNRYAHKLGESGREISRQFLYEETKKDGIRETGQ
jgi:hypothetical protein